MASPTKSWLRAIRASASSRRICLKRSQLHQQEHFKPQRAAGTQGKNGRKGTEKIPQQRRDHAEATTDQGGP